MPKNGKMTTKTLAACAILAAIAVILARFIIPMPNSTTRFSVEQVPTVAAGILFGPVAGALVGFVSDFIGCLFSGYGWNPVFSLPPILYGLCAGLMRPILLRKVSFFRILLLLLPAGILGSLLWQSYWLSEIYGGKTFLAFLLARGIQFAIVLPLDALILRLLFRFRVFQRVGLWEPAKEDAAHDRK